MNIKPLHDYMVARQEIAKLKNAGVPKPWTDDPIFQNYRFCNVFREDDVVTKWIHDNIRVPYADHSMLWFMLAIARQINHPDTLSMLIEVADTVDEDWWIPEFMTENLIEYQNEGYKVYTGAYMIRGENNKNAPWVNWPKVRYTAEVVCGRLFEQRNDITPFLENCDSLQEAWKILNNDKYYIGWGPFLSYEWVTDLRHTRYLNQAADIMTWANAGPGAIRGLNRLNNRKLDKQVPAADTNQEMWECLNQLKTEDYWQDYELEMRDIEHSLCELDKYERVRLGQGRPRQKYLGV